jgi:GNAT superfamily N-acetyltransferase
MIRRYRSGDSDEIARIVHDAVHRLACADYTPRQLNAWASPDVDYAYWAERCERKKPFVYESHGAIAGFIELDPDGHIDGVFVAPRYARRGYMRALMAAVKEYAAARGVVRLYAEVSITARPFFERAGFIVDTENRALRKGVWLKNYLMHCDI